jgi:sulfite exporter TauE/SafE
VFQFIQDSSAFAPIVSAFLIGLFGGMHCIGMCGGIIGALSFAIPAQDRGKRWRILAAYNVGRILSYGLIGLLAGTLIYQFSGGHDLSVMRLIAGVLLIAMGLYLANWWHGITVLERIGAIFWKRIQPIGKRLMPVTNMRQALLLGGLWGWLPCGLVYTALAYALAQAHPLSSMWVMVAFGLGTLPLVLLSGVLAEQVKAIVSKRYVRSFIGVLVIVFGAWTIWGTVQHRSNDHSSMNHDSMNHGVMEDSVMNHSTMEHDSSTIVKVGTDVPITTSEPTQYSNQ